MISDNIYSNGRRMISLIVVCISKFEAAYLGQIYVLVCLSSFYKI